MRVDRIANLALLSLLVAMLGGCSLLDGPSGPLPGGRLRTGAIVSEPDVDWTFADGQMIELQLVEPLGSRTTAVMVHEGQLYVPCDLGFIFRRVPAFHPARWMLSLIYRVKHWHEDVLRDGPARSRWRTSSHLTTEAHRSPCRKQVSMALTSRPLRFRGGCA